MGHAVSTCTKLLALEHDVDYMGGPAPTPAEQPQGPQLALRIAYAPIQESLGSKLSPFAAGDEVAVVRLEKVKGWEPLGSRQERCARQRSATDKGGKLMWPEGHRFSSAQCFWGAKVVASDGKGGFEEHWCMLQVAHDPQDRQMENVKLAVNDAKDVASYAHRFNTQTARAVGAEAEPDEVPGVKVHAPVGCFVIGSAVPDVVAAGQAVTLSMYPSTQVKKFVFEGGEDFLELPQAFFHYVAWMSGGRELVADLQGMQDDDGVTLTDPVLLRASQPGIGDLLGVIGVPGAGGGQAEEGAKGEERFNLWHPRCGQLCKSFDPQRRSVHQRKNCGLSVPTCGVAGGGA
mmetsp:Transcript_62299/g.160651  ORF Transcript_62299/g.160651 Transcript_62299/m.160651 type:complete len:346 (-) Transcript_62299:393-1430(-)